MPKDVKKYKVANPREVPKGIPVLSNADATKHWYEGDDYAGEPAQWLLDDGFVIEVSNG